MKYLGILILLLLSCNRKYQFDYKVMDTANGHALMEFPENEIKDDKNAQVLQSIQKNGYRYVAYYIFATAGKGTSRTIIPEVYFSHDTAFLGLKFERNSFTPPYDYDLANLLQLEYRIYDTSIHNIIFLPPVLMSSASKSKAS